MPLSRSFTKQILSYIPESSSDDQGIEDEFERLILKRLKEDMDCEPQLNSERPRCFNDVYDKMLETPDINGLRDMADELLIVSQRNHNPFIAANLFWFLLALPKQGLDKVGRRDMKLDEALVRILQLVFSLDDTLDQRHLQVVTNPPQLGSVITEGYDCSVTSKYCNLDKCESTQIIEGGFPYFSGVQSITIKLAPSPYIRIVNQIIVSRAIVMLDNLFKKKMGLDTNQYLICHGDLYRDASLFLREKIGDSPAMQIIRSINDFFTFQVSPIEKILNMIWDLYLKTPKEQKQLLHRKMARSIDVPELINYFVDENLLN